MMNSLPLFVGLRYVRARSHKFFVSFITWVSLLCVCLGVAALIVILSAMNGLEGTLRDGLLSLSSHARIFVAPEARSGSQPEARNGSQPVDQTLDWNALAAKIRATPDVVSISPSIEMEALAVRKPDMLPVRLRGVDPANESEKAKLGGALVEGQLADLTPGSEHALIGRNTAITLGLGVGDTITVLVPTTDTNGMPEPRLREFTVAGVFDANVTEFDSLLIVALDDVRALLPDADTRLSLQVNFSDALLAPERVRALVPTLPAGLEMRDWAEDHASYFRAIRIEKTMVAIILMLIVAVASFYLVAMLAMVVTDKRNDIAILRTLGAEPGQILKVFLIQGGVIAWLGVLSGVLLGCLIGFYAGEIAAFLERLFRFEIFDSTVYVTTKIPSELHADQVLWIAGIAMVITLAATIYPAWRASRVPPAGALRYE